MYDSFIPLYFDLLLLSLFRRQHGSNSILNPLGLNHLLGSLWLMCDFLNTIQRQMSFLRAPL